MHDQPWFKSLRRQLLARRLPNAYIERFMDEMMDHFHDLTEESMKSEPDALAQLGEPEQVAKAAAEAYRRRTFLGRHPLIAFFTFAISPLFSFLLFVLVEMFAVYGVCYLAVSLIVAVFHIQDDSSRFPPILDCGLRYGLPILFVMVPSVVLMFVYSRLARRTTAACRWIVVSCGMISAIASAPIFSVGFNQKMARSFVGAGIWWPRTPMQIVQLAIPLALGCWLIRRQRIRDRMTPSREASPTIAAAA